MANIEGKAAITVKTVIFTEAWHPKLGFDATITVIAADGRHWYFFPPSSQKAYGKVDAARAMALAKATLIRGLHSRSFDARYDAKQSIELIESFDLSSVKVKKERMTTM